MDYCYISYETGYFLRCLCQNLSEFIGVAYIDWINFCFHLRNSVFRSKNIKMEDEKLINHEMKACGYNINHVTKLMGLLVTQWLPYLGFPFVSSFGNFIWNLWKYLLQVNVMNERGNGLFHHLNQKSMNCGWQTKPGPPVFLQIKCYWNTVTYIQLYIVYGWFSRMIVKLSRPGNTKSLKYLLSGPLWKKFVNS